MNILKKIVNSILILLLLNIVILMDIFKLGVTIHLISAILLGAFFVKYNIIPLKQNASKIKLNIMVNGYELIVNACMFFLLQIVVYVYVFTIQNKVTIAIPSVLINTILSIVLILLVLWNGILRIIITSSQVGIILKICLFFSWWIPILNLLFFWKCCHIVRREYIFEVSKIEMNNQRKKSEICKTRYPILLVHGIFWRDWQFFNYWGRIPSELTKNGATIYYGNQQSAASMEICANELKEQILMIIKKEKCEKVNIIGHSKGGLDARYVCSRLGIEKNIASLTTIGTPHKGCKLVDRILDKISDKCLRTIAKRYNSAYLKMGDKTPDFYRGIYDLTTSKCKEFNTMVPDREGIVYQSVASRVNSFFSAGFPLNIGYALIKGKDGENDGFVTVESAKHGDYLGCFSTKRNRGVSHGDMIDLMRENIYGFDVNEFYIDIVKGLKARGL